jgi:DNA-binding NtrC family response regulator
MAVADQILVVDDETGIRELLSEILSDEGYQVHLAANAEEARKVRTQLRPELVLLDIWMPGMDGVSLLREWSSGGLLNMPVVMMSGHATVDTAVEATRIGAVDFLEKPIALPKLLATVKRALSKGKAEYRPEITLHQLGRSARIDELRRQLERMVNHNAPVLITGEPGCGIELAARYLQRPQTPWFESADNQWLAQNAFEPLASTQGGIIFVGGIHALEPAEQRGLEQLLGKLEKHHVRLVCGSHYSVAQLHAENSLDQQLLAKLSALVVSVPPLRDHAEDIPDLANALLAQLMEAGEIPVTTLAVAAQNQLRQLPWPGNIPMLTNALRVMAVSINGGEIGAETVEHLSAEWIAAAEQAAPPAVPMADFGLPLREAREQFERAYFLHLLELESGNAARVAERSGLERTHLYRKLKQLGISLPQHRGG